MRIGNLVEVHYQDWAGLGRLVKIDKRTSVNHVDMLTGLRAGSRGSFGNPKNVTLASPVTIVFGEEIVQL